MTQTAFPGVERREATRMSAATTLEALIVEQTAEAVIYANREGVIERWNAAAAAMFGYAATEALGQNLDLMIPEHLRNAHWRGFDAAIASGKTRLGGRPTLTRGLHKSGKKLYVEMSFALVRDGAGSTLGAVAVARDVTERVAREKAAAGGGAHS
jgi:PAS domain S-box-containing protein